jgi:DNA end-binding protein Ku
MARAIWTGSIGFGLVNIPVRLFNAVAPRTVRFHEFDRETGRRIHHRRVVDEPRGSEPSGGPGDLAGDTAITSRPSEPAPPPDDAGEIDRSTSMGRPGRQPDREDREEAEVPYEEVVRGYEVEPGRFVMLTPEELRELRPERTRTIDIQEFVSLDDIDPVFFDRSYYVSPGRGAAAEKPYTLLLRALQRSRKVGIGSFVLTSRLHLAAVRPREDVLVLETLFYGDEVRSVSEIDYPPSLAEPSSRELDVAVRLVELLGAPWDPSGYRDDYRERVLEVIRSKTPEATRMEETAEPAPAAGVADLMAALQASVEAARTSTAGRPRSRRRTG